MATDSVLDFEILLAPIRDDRPPGGPVPFSVREQLDQARKEVHPEDFDERDPTRPTETKHADWQGIIDLGRQTLTETSKDLMVAARLTEALTKVHRFAGLRDGLKLMRLLVEECWDRIYPLIEEPDDVEARASAFNWLDDTDRGARFPTSVRQVPLVMGAKHSPSWMDWSLTRTGSGPIGTEDFEQSILSSPRSTCKNVLEDLDETIQELKQLLEVLNERMGALAPALTMLRQTVIECHTLARQVLEQKGPEEPEPGEEADGESDGESTGSRKSSAPRAMATRAQVYQTLREAASVLERLEPHSPIPYVIRRAVHLGDLGFPQLIKELIKDSGVLSELSRNLGIEELKE